MRKVVVSQAVYVNPTTGILNADVNLSREAFEMAVWTISAQEGTAGDRVAARLAASAGVPLLDRASLEVFARELNPEIGDIEDLQESAGGLIKLAGLSVGMTGGSVDAFRELQVRRTLPELGRTIMSEAARSPCVILAAGAFAALPDHCSAVHVRLWAPAEWRIRTCQREHVVDRRSAEKAVRHDDHVKRVWVKSLFGVDVDDFRRFTLVLDASRLSEDRLLEILLAAGGVGLPSCSPVASAQESVN